LKSLRKEYKRISDANVNTETIVRFWVPDMCMPKTGRKYRFNRKVESALNMTLSMTSAIDAIIV